MASWSEETLSRIDFLTMLQQDEFWKDHEGGVDAALSGGKDILRLAQGQASAPEVVLLTEGYTKQQPSALDKQLPLSARAKELPLPPAPPLFWTPSAGDPEARVPVGVMERCKLLEVQYILKQYQPPAQPPKTPAEQPQPDGAAADAGGEGGAAPPAAAAPAAPPAPQDGDAAAGAGSDDNKSDDDEEEEGMQHLWPHQRRQLKQQRRAQRAQCQRLSLRVILQRMPQPKPEKDSEDDDDEEQQDEEQGQQEANGHMQPAAAAAAAGGGAAAAPDDDQEYTCSLEYPAFTLGSSDYLVAGDVYDRGIKTWQTLQNGDPFTMLWDGEPYKGFALGYRHRKLSDPYFGSPWWSVAVGWENHGTDRRSDPEDWCFGNPWEMNRPPGHEIQPLPDTAHAMLAGHKAGRPVQAAPWTRVGRKAARAAAARANARRARPGGLSHHNDFVYDSNDEDGDPDAEDWDPTENFPSEDDADEFELHAGRRRRAGRQQNGSRSASRRRATGARRTGSEGPPGEAAEAGGPAAAGKGASSAKAKKKAAAGADGKDGDLTHNYGRDMVLPEGVCLVCRQREGVLVNGHTGRTGGGCSRQYHAGCLLMLQAAGIRSLVLTKGAGAGSKQQRKGVGGSQAKSPAGGGPVAASDVQQLCDGLLGELQGQLQQPDHGLSAATVAAVATAETAAQMVVNGQVALTCPAHSCHGCLLNGKHEFMVWCCCCYVRVYHHRNCVPYGAEHIQLGGRDFIRCPHCVAANVLPKAARIKRPAASTATAAASIGGGGGGADSAAAGGGRAPAAASAAAASGAGASGAAAAAEPTPNSGMDVAELLDLLAGAAAAAEADGGGGGGADGDAMDVDGAAGNDGSAPACCGHDGDAGHGGHAAAAAGGGGPPADAAPAAAPLGPAQLLTSASSANAGQTDSLAEARRPLGVGAAVAAVAEAAAEAAAFAAGGGAAAANGGQPAGVLLPLFKQEQPQQQQASTAAADARGGDTIMSEGDQAAASPAQQQQQQQANVKVEVPPPPPQPAKPSMLLSSLQQQLSPKPPRPPQQQQQQQRQHSLMQMEDEIQLLHQRRQQQQQQRPVASGSAMPAASEADTGADEDDGRYGAASGQLRDDEGSVDDEDAGDESEGWGLQPGIIPAWLQLAIEDEERRAPSYQLVQCGEDGGALDVDNPLASRAALDPVTRRPVLCITAAAARPMPPLPPVGGAAAAAAAGAAFADEDEDEPALPLASPHCNWLVGSRSKAEAVYKVANSWGVPIIGVPLAADDSVYGLSVVVDHLPTLRQCAAAAGLLGEDAAAAEAAAAATGAARARPGVYLRCNRVVTQSGELQSPSQPPADGSAAESARGRSGKEWQVMVNGEAYPARQGRQGVELQPGDVVTVQGLSFKLELA